VGWANNSVAQCSLPRLPRRYVLVAVRCTPCSSSHRTVSLRAGWANNGVVQCSLPRLPIKGLSWWETAKTSALRRCYGAHSRVYPSRYALVVARRAPCPASRLAISRVRRAHCEAVLVGALAFSYCLHHTSAYRLSGSCLSPQKKAIREYTR
jgi:hypothetical protein